MFLLVFLRIYGIMLLNLSPVIALLVLVILLLGMRMSRIEGWSRSRGVYCAFITATTVGYGVVHPTKPRSRVVAIIIAFVGLVLTGILVALAFKALETAADLTGLSDRIYGKLQGMVGE